MHDIQAVLFDTRYRYKKWTTDKARKWLKSHGYKPIKRVDETEHFLHYRIREPRDNFKYRTVKIGAGIELTLEFPKKEKKEKDPQSKSSESDELTIEPPTNSKSDELEVLYSEPMEMI